MFDYLIVGSGLFGSVFAQLATAKGKKCLVIEERQHIGGNCYSESIENIHVCKYGGHIFHTNNSAIWNYFDKFCKLRPYAHFVRANNGGKVFSFPINLMTLNQLHGINKPHEAHQYLRDNCSNISNPRNLEEWCLTNVGKELYELFIKGYTSKHWDRKPTDLPPFLIKRLPLRFTYENTYFEDTYQGFPEKGYTELFNNLLENAQVELGCDYFQKRDYYDNLAKKVVYTGPIDKFFNYCDGKLDYRSLKHKNFILEGDYQGCATVNYTGMDRKFTRIIEHKHFQPHKNNPKTVITVEWSSGYDGSNLPFYPINDQVNNQIFRSYKRRIQKSKYIFGGRLADYKYYDMHMVIGKVLAMQKVI